MESTKSLWEKTVSVPSYPSFTGDSHTDVLIIGGGIAGILTAYMLTEKGVRCTVLEAASLFSGQTGRTTAKITSQHGLIYEKMIRTHGFATARAYAEASEAAIAEYRRIANEKNIECEMETLPAYVYSTDREALKRETESAIALGLPASFVTETELPFSAAGAVRFEKQAQFHPLKFLTALLPGLEIYENSPVLAIKGRSVTVPGGTIHAKKLIFATNFPKINLPGFYFMRMHRERSYVIALESAFHLHGMYYGADKDGFSLRGAGDGVILLGGAGHRTGKNPDGGSFQTLKQAAERLFPGAQILCQWSAQDCMTPDHIPYIGRFSKNTPDTYVATGFCKWGMTSAMVAAKLLCDLIRKKPNRYASVFSPSRKLVGIAAVLSDGIQTAGSLAKQVFYLPNRDARTIPPGHGGIVQIGGHKRGVYREILPDGKTKLHVVSVKCPHLGCELVWNPDEKSWDCPCHGSRFDIDGRLLDGPAEKGVGKTR